jgi:hypothetical protein
VIFEFKHVSKIKSLVLMIGGRSMGGGDLGVKPPPKLGNIYYQYI